MLGASVGGSTGDAVGDAMGTIGEAVRGTTGDAVSGTTGEAVGGVTGDGVGDTMTGAAVGEVTTTGDAVGGATGHGVTGDAVGAATGVGGTTGDVAGAGVTPGLGTQATSSVWTNRVWLSWSVVRKTCAVMDPAARYNVTADHDLTHTLQVPIIQSTTSKVRSGDPSFKTMTKDDPSGFSMTSVFVFHSGWLEKMRCAPGVTNLLKWPSA